MSLTCRNLLRREQEDGGVNCGDTTNDVLSIWSIVLSDFFRGLRLYF